MLRPPFLPCCKILYPINYRISRKALSGEHFASLGQFSLKSDQQAVDDSSLGFIRRILVGLMPYVSLAKNSAQRFVGSINSPPKAAEEPVQPRRDIQAVLLGGLKYIFIYIILLW